MGAKNADLFFFAEMSEILEASCRSAFDDTKKERND